MYQSTIRSILLVGALTACSADPNDPIGHGQDPLSTSTGDVESGPIEGGTGEVVTNCVDTQCPPPPPEWCSSDTSNTSLPEELVAYWNLSCETVCGDGILNDTEVCDDGNTVSGDGCEGDCGSIESGFECGAPGTSCYSR